LLSNLGLIPKIKDEDFDYEESGAEDATAAKKKVSEESE